MSDESKKHSIRAKCCILADLMRHVAMLTVWQSGTLDLPVAMISAGILLNGRAQEE